MKYKVLSLNPPYASLIAACEHFPDLGKHIETRSWRTPYRGTLLIHQTKGLGDMFVREADLWDLCLSEPFRTTLTAAGYGNPGRLPRGAIVAVCELVDCWPTCGDGYETVVGDDVLAFAHWHRVSDQELAFGDYTPGRYAWRLSDIRMLPEPIPARGQLGLWTWEGELKL